MRDLTTKAAIDLIVFFAAAVLLTGLLVLSAMIPKEAIQDNMASSADVMCENIVFFNISEGINASKIDRYADSITLNIAYCFDSKHPLTSVAKSSYYFTDHQNENDNLRDAVTNGCKKNREYLRYWHGSAGVARAAHLFTDINGMYTINAVLITLLNGLLLFILIKNRLYAGAVGTVAALAAAGIWYVPLSLQSTWVFLLTPAVSVIAVLFTLKGKTGMLGPLFMVSGMIINFLDFLTCETLVLVMPLLLTIYVRRSRDPVPPKEEAINAAKLCALWLIGYAGMWVLKWAFASAVLGEDVMSYVSGHISERTVGELTDGNEGFMSILISSLVRNTGCLFPLGYGGPGVLAAIFIAVAAAFVCFVFRRGGIKASDLLIYAAAGAIPYIRFAVLLGHSHLHYFFTYRALAGTMLAICLIIWEIIRPGRAKHEASKRKRA